MNRVFDAHLIRRIAVESFTDPRSVRRYLVGKHIRPTTRARLSEAFARLGLKPPAKHKRPEERGRR